MRIDAHQHFWRYDPVRDDWITPEMSVLQRDFMPRDLLPLLGKNGVAGSVAVQAAQSEEETRFLLGLAEEHEEVLGVVGWVDLLSPDLPERLEELARSPRLRGVRHIAQAEPDEFLTREGVLRGIGELRRFGLTYDILVYSRQLPAALALVERLPDQPFVVDHLAKPPISAGVLEPWASMMQAMARRPNVWCKVSGMVTEADWAGWRHGDFEPYFQVVLDAFGPERLMFGSDWPVCLLAAQYADAVELAETLTEPLSASERARVFGENAVAFYGLTI